MEKLRLYAGIRALQNTLCTFLAVWVLVSHSASVYAHNCPYPEPPCGGSCHIAQDLAGIGTCECSDTNDAEDSVIEHHEDGETDILTHMREQFHLHREWVVWNYIYDLFPQSLMLMTEQMSNVAMYQMLSVGKMYDSKLHLESQRLFNELQNEAAKDYQPSDSFCYFGTNVRSLAHSENLSLTQQASLNQIALSRQLGNANSATTAGDGTKGRRAPDST